jgi:two-component system, NarL family, sensor histidine kinase DesK
MRISEERSQQVFGFVWAAVWTWPLLGPAGAVLSGRVHPLVPAAVGLVVFVALYLVIIVDAFDERTVRSTRFTAVALGSLSLVGISLSAGYVGEPEGWLTPLMYVAVCGAATLPRPYRFLGWLGLCCAATVVIGTLHHQPSGDVGGSVFGTVMGSLLVFVVRQMSGLIRELRSTQKALADTAVAQERLRFSRDLHDLLGHTLSLMVVKAELARRLAPTDGAAAAREAGDIETIGRRALAEVREAVTGYRERILADELDGARTALIGAGIDVIVRESGTPLPGPVDDVFAWAVREGTTNVIRHSGASRCTIEVRRDDDRATVEVIDNGTRSARSGPPAADRGNGLRGLAERLDALGGSLRAENRADGGFRLTATAPSLVDSPVSTTVGAA